MTEPSGNMKSPPPGTDEEVPPTVPTWLLLEDGPLLAVNKPAGLLTEGAPGAVPTLVGVVRNWLRVRYSKPGNVYLGIPHRLDRPTSGVIVFTRNSKTAARVAEQFERRQVTKVYWALLEQPPEHDSGELVDWIRKIPEEARSEITRPDADQAREARLSYRLIGTVAGKHLAEIRLGTGRMHQIRVQFASRGCPIVGDVKYGGSEWTASGSRAPVDDSIGPGESTTWLAAPIALHARSLTLKHPIRYDDVTVTAPLPDFWNVPDAGRDPPPASDVREITRAPTGRPQPTDDTTY